MALPTLVGNASGMKVTFPTLVGNTSGTKVALPTLVGNASGTNGTFPTLVGNVQGKQELPTLVGDYVFFYYFLESIPQINLCI